MGKNDDIEPNLDFFEGVKHKKQVFENSTRRTFTSLDTDKIVERFEKSRFPAGVRSGEKEGYIQIGIQYKTEAGEIKYYSKSYSTQQMAEQDITLEMLMEETFDFFDDDGASYGVSGIGSVYVAVNY